MDSAPCQVSSARLKFCAVPMMSGALSTYTRQKRQQLHEGGLALLPRSQHQQSAEPSAGWSFNSRPLIRTYFCHRQQPQFENVLKRTRSTSKPRVVSGVSGPVGTVAIRGVSLPTSSTKLSQLPANPSDSIPNAFRSAGAPPSDFNTLQQLRADPSGHLRVIRDIESDAHTPTPKPPEQRQQAQATSMASKELETALKTLLTCGFQPSHRSHDHQLSKITNAMFFRRGDDRDGQVAGRKIIWVRPHPLRARSERLTRLRLALLSTAGLGSCRSMSLPSVPRLCVTRMLDARRDVGGHHTNLDTFLSVASFTGSSTDVASTAGEPEVCTAIGGVV